MMAHCPKTTLKASSTLPGGISVESFETETWVAVMTEALKEQYGREEKRNGGASPHEGL
jgi:hypothetical protein